VVFRSAPAKQRDSVAAEIASLSTLDDPVRAEIFFHVARSGGYVTRDQAAKDLGITRRTAAFHLDKLAEAGLVDVSFKRVTGRTGPGAGRSSKLYRRSARRLNISIPSRNYELMARLLASVVQQTDEASAPQIESQAKAFGVSKGAAARNQVSRSTSRKQLKQVLVNELAALGFEPLDDATGTLRLGNCPYHDMARENASFVCSMNLALMQGVVEGLELTEVSAALEPIEGMCCVAFRTNADAIEPTGVGIQN
jgi:predicted ArsR family transcriptional regulator